MPQTNQPHFPFLPSLDTLSLVIVARAAHLIPAYYSLRRIVFRLCLETLPFPGQATSNNHLVSRTTTHNCRENASRVSWLADHERYKS